MRILVVGLNYAPEVVGTAVYTAGMARALVQRGHSVTVVCGQPYYPNWRTQIGYSASSYTRQVEDGVSVVRCPLYVPSIPSGPKRLAHLVSFGAAALIPALSCSLRESPEVVLAIAPSMLTAPVARLAAAVCGAKAWLHVQDFEVEAAFATGLLSPGSMFGRIALAFEGAVIKTFHSTSAISPQMCARLRQKGVGSDRVVEFRNWGVHSEIKPISTASSYREEWGINSRYVALYSGSIANKQGMEIVIDAARRMRHRIDVTFVICGEGPNRAKFEASTRELPNIQFRDLQPAERLNELLGLATVHLLPQLGGAADLVLPSKLINMLRSGRPIVATASPNTGLAIELDGCGLVTMPGDTAAFADAIQRLMDDSDLYANTSANAVAKAEAQWSGASILDNFERNLTRLACTRAPVT